MERFLNRAIQRRAEYRHDRSQNPVADLISVPLQNNFNLNVGSEEDLQYVLDVQPVIPICQVTGHTARNRRRWKS